MARKKIFQVRLSDKEWERLEREANRREIPASQLFREFLKTLEREGEMAEAG